MYFHSERLDRSFREFLQKSGDRVAVTVGLNETQLQLAVKTIGGNRRRIILSLPEEKYLVASASMRQACMTDELHAALLLMDLFDYPGYTLALRHNERFVLKASRSAEKLDSYADWFDLTIRLASGAEKIETVLQRGMMYETNWRYRAVFELEDLRYYPAPE
jgi:hypothetical protein